MKLSQTPKVLRRAIATYECLRRLGFEAADLHVDTARSATTPGQPISVFVVLRLRNAETDEEVSCPIDIGPARDDHGPILDLQARWTQAIGLWNSRETPQADKMRLWTEFMPRALQDKLVLALTEAGVEIPIPPGGRQ